MADSLKALLVAAGVGSRLRPLTNSLPKCLMPINGMPLLGYWLQLLTGCGVKEIAINLHHLPELVARYISLSPYKDLVRTSMEQTLLGTGGTLLRHKHLFSEGSVLFAHADNLTLFSLRDFHERHINRPKECAVTMMTFNTQTPKECGIVKCDSRGIVKEFHEKSSQNHGTLANAAVYILEKEVVDFIEGVEKREIDFSIDVIPNFVDRIQTFHNNQYHRDIGRLPSYLNAQFEFGYFKSKFCYEFKEDHAWHEMIEETEGLLSNKIKESIEEIF